MRQQSPISTYSLLSFVCATFGHDYTISRKITDYMSEYKCSHCGKEVSDNMHGTLELLTAKVKNANTSLATFYKKKTRKISA